MSTKNSEVKVRINGVERIILVPVDNSKMNVVQSVKSKSNSEIALYWLKGDKDKAREIINKIAAKYQELVEPGIKEFFSMLPGEFTIEYTEANNLMTFGEIVSRQIVEVYEQKWFKVTITESESNELALS